MHAHRLPASRYIIETMDDARLAHGHISMIHGTLAVPSRSSNETMDQHRAELPQGARGRKLIQATLIGEPKATALPGVPAVVNFRWSKTYGGQCGRNSCQKS